MLQIQTKMASWPFYRYRVSHDLDHSDIDNVIFYSFSRTCLYLLMQRSNHFVFDKTSNQVIYLLLCTRFTLETCISFWRYHVCLYERNLYEHHTINNIANQSFYLITGAIVGFFTLQLVRREGIAFRALRKVLVVDVTSKIGHICLSRCELVI
ncbi:hypothetical protein K501DRAFT_334442 [Backusella circina FSU 941]|nr:hypothetical protein K501DRAFT_334442 [Backusella circina FSU 941]